MLRFAIPFWHKTGTLFGALLLVRKRESLRTKGRDEVTRRETKRVFKARAGRRSRTSRGSEVKRKDDGSAA